MNAGQKWDQVSDKFNTYKEEVWHGAADNIATVWPVILDYVKKYFSNPNGQRALEFGCGTGMFCRELQKLGFKVTGIDISSEMVGIGKKNLDPDIKLLVGDAASAQKEGPFSLVTSIMVLQFLKKKELIQLVDAVATKGHLIFAVHNPEQLDARGVTDTLTLTGTNVSMPVYKRPAKEYHEIFENSGLTKTLENYAQASKEFLLKHNLVGNEDIPKYMILGYQKN